MTTREFLTQGRRIESGIHARLSELERLRSLAARTTRNLSQAPSHGVSSGRGAIETAVLRITELETEIISELDALFETKDAIRDAINRLPRPKERIAMQLYYLSGYDWKAVAEQMHYSERQLYRLHGNALEKLEKMSPNVT